MRSSWVTVITLALSRLPGAAAAAEQGLPQAPAEQASPAQPAPLQAHPVASPEAREASVYFINPKVDYPVLGVAALGAAVPFFLEKDIIDKSCNCTADNVNRFDRYVIRHHSKLASTGSHLVVVAALTGPIVYERIEVGWNKTFMEDMMVYAQTLAINSAVANIARYGVQRPRPDAYRKPQPVTEAQEFASFYSGHTASVVSALSAFSMTYNYRHGRTVWPWVVTAGAGVTDGMLRVFAGRHFYTDSLAGLGAGAAIGILVPMLHRRHGSDTWSLVPAEDGARLAWRREF